MKTAYVSFPISVDRGNELRAQGYAIDLIENAPDELPEDCIIEGAEPAADAADEPEQ